MTKIDGFQLTVPLHLACFLAPPGSSCRGGVLGPLRGRFLGPIQFSCQIVPFGYRSGRLEASETGGCFAPDLACSFDGSVVVLSRLLGQAQPVLAAKSCAFWHRLSHRKLKMYAFCTACGGVPTPGARVKHTYFSSRSAPAEPKLITLIELDDPLWPLRVRDA